MDREFRYYQVEADNAIYEELLINNKCLVKMFCGTGKSLLMRKCKSVQNKSLIVYVFPTLSLIEQFYTNYLYDFPTVLKISSENDSTTDATEIVAFLSQQTNKIICVTYQSYRELHELLRRVELERVASPL